MSDNEEYLNRYAAKLAQEDPEFAADIDKPYYEAYDRGVFKDHTKYDKRADIGQFARVFGSIALPAVRTMLSTQYPKISRDNPAWQKDMASSLDERISKNRAKAVLVKRVSADNAKKQARRDAYLEAANTMELPEEYEGIRPLLKTAAVHDPESFSSLVSKMAEYAIRPREPKTPVVQYSPEALAAYAQGDPLPMQREYYASRGTSAPPPRIPSADEPYKPMTAEEWADYEKKLQLQNKYGINRAVAIETAKDKTEKETEGNTAYVPGLKLGEGYEVDKTGVSKVRAASGNYAAARQTLDRIAKLYNEKGLRPFGDLAREYESLVTQLQLDVKGEGFAQLGVLAGPDMDILMGLVPDPSSWGALVKKMAPGMGDPITPKINAARRYLDNQFGSKIRAQGFEIDDISKLLGHENSYNFATPADAEAAERNGELMKGSVIYINGKRAGTVE